MNRATELYGQPWRPREMVIALDAYIRNREKPRHVSADWILAVAHQLGRTPSSVLMRMANFASLDPLNRDVRQGLGKGGPLCERIFWDWYSRTDHLHAVAGFLIADSTAEHPDVLDLFRADPVRIPRAFGRYELMDPLGHGGFGSVFSCIAPDVLELRALKVIRIELVEDREVLNRFYREIRALKSVEHPHVVRIYEDNLDSERELPGFVMDLAESNLTDYIRQRARASGSSERPPLSTEEAICVLESVMHAVQALHEHKPCIIHRDINPNNILLLPNRTWVLADFGLSKFIHTAPVSTAFATQTQGGFGTGFYAAPEQYRDFRSCRIQTDIYAIGMLIWDLLSSNWPLPDRSDTGLADSLASVFLRATNRDPATRYRTTAELRDAFLQAVLEVPR